MTDPVPARPGEFELIARYFRPLATVEGAFSLLDDAASVPVEAGRDLVMTLDTLAAGVHFFPDDPAASVARKVIGVNISDLAAKGADPIGYLVSLALPADWTEDWVRGFSEGLAQAQREYGISLIGGDTIRSNGGLQIAITAYGSVPAGTMVPRGGAEPGDSVYVTGTIGDAALGLQLRLDPAAGTRWSLTEDQAAHLGDRYLHPQPRHQLAGALPGTVHAAMDVSDGLVGDLKKMCEVSGVSASLEVAEIPLSDAARTCIARDGDALKTALTGGDDYELLTAVPEAKAPAFEQAAQAAGLSVSRVGMVSVGSGEVTLLAADGSPLAFSGGSFKHF